MLIATLEDIARLRESVDLEDKLARGADGKGRYSGTSGLPTVRSPTPAGA